MVRDALARLGSLDQARAEFGMGEWINAWNATLDAMRERPFHPEAWLTLGEIAAEAGDVKAARRCCSAAESLAPRLAAVRRLSKQLRKKNGGGSLEWTNVPAELQPAAKPRLSVILITKNEENFLDQCLSSVKDIADQIVVVDTGSTDATVEIARRHDAEIHHFAWNDDFSAARNESLLHARGDWVLFIDADEELLELGRDALVEAMKQTDALAWRLPIVDVGREHLSQSFVPRLFRNAPGLFFVGRIHEQVSSSVEVRCEQWGLAHRIGNRLKSREDVTIV